MAFEDVPAGTPSDGNFKVLFVPAIADIDSPTEAELTASGVIALTYSITGDGYTHTVTVNKITANRLTLPVPIQYDGTETHELSVTYAYTNKAGDVIRIGLPQGTKGYIVERWAVANEEAFETGQIVDVIPVTASKHIKNAPVMNQELTRTLALNISGRVASDVLVA